MPLLLTVITYIIRSRTPFRISLEEKTGRVAL